LLQSIPVDFTLGGRGRNGGGGRQAELAEQAAHQACFAAHLSRDDFSDLAGVVARGRASKGARRRRRSSGLTTR
jgi:hypothetical protein